MELGVVDLEVARAVAESVVDALERVDVEEQQPNTTWPALEGEKRLSQTVDQRHAVRQGQRA